MDLQKHEKVLEARSIRLAVFTTHSNSRHEYDSDVLSGECEAGQVVAQIELSHQSKYKQTVKRLTTVRRVTDEEGVYFVFAAA